MDGRAQAQCPECGHELRVYSSNDFVRFSSDSSTQSMDGVSDSRRSEAIGTTKIDLSARYRRTDPLENTKLVDIPSQGSAQADVDDDLWTSAAERTEIAPIEQLRSSPPDNGPDPTPTRRVSRGPKTRSPIGEKRPKKSLDHARPVPIEASDHRPLSESGAGSMPKDRSSIFDQSPAKSDAIAAILSHHLEASSPQTGQASRSTRSRHIPWASGITVLILLGLVFTAILTRPDVPQIPLNAVPEVSAQARLAPAIESHGIRLMSASQVDEFDDDFWLVLGLDSASSSPGKRLDSLSLKALNRTLTVDEEGGGYVPTISETLGQEEDRDDLLGLAIDRSASAEDLGIICRSAMRSGFSEFGLIVERVEDALFGYFKFSFGDGRIPASGHLLVQVAGLGVRADIVGRDGAFETPIGQIIKDSDDGGLNFKALDERLEALAVRYPLVRVASLYLETGLDLGSIIKIIELVRFGPKKERFTEIRLIIR